MPNPARSASPLNARNRFGKAVVEIVAEDLERLGPEAIERLRRREPAAWTRLCYDVADLRTRLRHAAYPAEGHRRPTPSKRDCFALALLDAVSQDFAVNGAAVIASLRTHPRAYAALLKQVVRFDMLARQRPKIEPKRKERELRAKAMVAKLAQPPALDPAHTGLPEDKAAAVSGGPTSRPGWEVVASNFCCSASSS